MNILDTLPEDGITIRVVELGDYVGSGDDRLDLAPGVGTFTTVDGVLTEWVIE